MLGEEGVVGEEGVEGDLRATEMEGVIRSSRATRTLFLTHILTLTMILTLQYPYPYP